MLTGRCLCGAVEIRVERHEPAVSGCHCGRCRRWTGGVLFGFEAPADAVAVTGPVKSFRSSPFAERAWCERCGTHLWIRDDGGPYDLMPGFFDGTAEAPLTHEVYADRAPAWAALAGEHPRVTAAEYEAAHPFVDDAS